MRETKEGVSRVVTSCRILDCEAQTGNGGGGPHLSGTHRQLFVLPNLHPLPRPHSPLTISPTRRASRRLTARGDGGGAGRPGSRPLAVTIIRCWARRTPCPAVSGGCPTLGWPIQIGRASCRES